MSDDDLSYGFWFYYANVNGGKWLSIIKHWTDAEAACLSLGENPDEELNRPVLNGKIAGRIREIQAAIDSEELKAKNGKIERMAFIKWGIETQDCELNKKNHFEFSEELREWYENLTQRREPPATQPPEATPDKADISESERESVLKLILGMAIDAYGYKPFTERSSATGTNKGSIHYALSAIPELSIKDAKTIRKYIKEAEALFLKPPAKP